MKGSNFIHAYLELDFNKVLFALNNNGVIEYEIWKNITGYDNKYQCSNFGRIRRITYSTLTKNGILRRYESKIMVQSKRKEGYLSVGLHKNKKQKTFRVQRIVASAFLKNKESKEDVNHIDENKVNNYYENLEWNTRKENINHGTRTERAAFSQRKRSDCKKVNQLDLQGNLVKKWNSIGEAKRNGFNDSNIISCCNGNRKTHKKHKWDYA